MSQGLEGEGYEAILARRAATLARSPDEHAARRIAVRVVVVAAGGERVGIPIHGVREIVRAGRVMALPGLPSWAKGVTSVRGEIVSVVDLAAWLHQGGAEDAAFIAVLDGPRGPVAFLIDEVLGLREVLAEELASGLGGDDDRRGPIAATTRDLVSLLDLDAMTRGDALVASGRRPAAGPRHNGERSEQGDSRGEER
jgi:purine-binding chemotaxis protein CheW